MNRLENDILALLESGEPVALATIVSLAGSAPRTPGTRMAVRRDGAILGTIGGGRLEAEVIQAGRESLHTGKSLLKHFELTGKDAREMDMICGGVLDILVEPLSSDAQTVALLHTFERLRDAGKELLLVTLLRDAPDYEKQLLSERLLVEQTPEGPVFHPRRPENHNLLLPLLETAMAERCPTMFTIEDERENDRVVIEPVLASGTIHLFGAGHVSKEVAALAHQVDFRVEVYDDRPEFANRERFPRAAAVHVPEDMAEALDPKRIDPNSYVVIITRGHKYDMDVLAQALRTEPCYIGMIGSRRKRDKIYESLRKQGFKEADLSCVRCPVGLDIHAETPAEIALSIVAELVSFRASMKDRT
ncbi:XdhC family aldehyde oxidoreductase maturation factor [Desulfonatronum sp. SC1]|uniref:XdhC family aldehyde oxidoreductase maturation factor n=1 Tax=Desulfonatronum sp. SC1 TaxID=2109626 RepID=UPI000D315514|nr:XdhC/CoxI family protein [Desulfonatronum sp. SC1]PTN37846.1 dehydrogenase [Desulfonatronum sp. SC1]